MIRLVRDRSAEIRRGERIGFTFDGRAITGFAGDTVAVALMRAGVIHLRDAPGEGTPRGMFCAMGLCQECVVRVAGEIVEACRLPVTEGLNVERASSRR